MKKNLIESLRKECEELEEIFYNRKEEILKREEEKNKNDPNESLNNWNVMIEETKDNRFQLRKKRFELKKIEEIQWEEIPEYGDLLTIGDFKESCEYGGFIDYDGFGKYATEEKMSNLSISPSDFKNELIISNPEFTHIVWFNR